MRNAILLLIVAVAVAGGAWYYWPSSGGEVRISGSSRESGEALALVTRIKAIDLDMSLLDDSDFLSLESVPAPSYDAFTQGRANPFLKLVSSETKPPIRPSAR